MGNFGETMHSVFEKDFKRTAFRENTDAQEFMIQTEEDAEDTIRAIVKDLLSSSRPLNERQYTLVLTFIRDHLDNWYYVKKKDS